LQRRKVRLSELDWSKVRYPEGEGARAGFQICSNTFLLPQRMKGGSHLLQEWVSLFYQGFLRVSQAALVL
jgi:hypothetical protein